MARTLIKTSVMEGELKLIDDELALIVKLETVFPEDQEYFVDSYIRMIGYFRALGTSIKAFLPDSPKAASLKEAIVSGFDKDLKNLCIIGLMLVTRFKETEEESKSKANMLLQAYRKAVESLRSYEDSYSVSN